MLDRLYLWYNDKIENEDLNISLNQVRQRVNASMPALTKEFAQTHGLDMRTEIRRERTVELFNEGFRIDDLKRWKTAENEMPQAMLGIKWKGTQYESWNTPFSLNEKQVASGQIRTICIHCLPISYS